MSFIETCAPNQSLIFDWNVAKKMIKVFDIKLDGVGPADNRPSTD